MTRSKSHVSALFACAVLLVAAIAGFAAGFSRAKTYAKYASTKTNSANVTLSVEMPHYIVVFNSNGGTGTMLDQELIYGTPEALSLNIFTRGGHVFTGWNTESDGSGTHYEDGEEVDKLAESGTVTLYAQWEEGELRTVFEQNGACTFNGSDGFITGDECADYHGQKYINTGVKLYDYDHYELDYEFGFTIVHYSPSENSGETQATFANTKHESGGDTGNPGLAVRRNQNNIEITQMINNIKVSKTVSANTVTKIKIIRKDGVVYYSVNDGDPILLQSMIGTTDYADVELWFGAAADVNGDPMRIINATLSNIYVKVGENNKVKHVVTFDPQGGEVSPSAVAVFDSTAIGELPVPTKEGKYFAGWFTEGGQRITRSTIITEDVTAIARWNDNNNACSINGVEKATIRECIASATGGVATITFLRDVSENITVGAGRDITFDLGEYVLSNGSNGPVISNKGTVRIINGVIESDAPNAGVFNNEDSGGKLYMSGGKIIATGLRQAVYNKGGYVEITGDAYLSNVTDQRAAVHNLNNGEVKILGGTIVSHSQNGIQNDSGTVTIGSEDGVYDKSSPTIQGAKNGINTTRAGISIYDGTVMGIEHAINGTNLITGIEAGSTLFTGEETVNNVTYQILYYTLN